MAARRPRRQARRNGSPALPGWVWLLGGLLLGFALFAFVFLREQWGSGPAGPRPNPDARPPAAGEPPVAQGADSAPRKPRYDFYTLLPERESVIPDAELRATARAEREAPAAAPAQAVRYLLQAGSFGDPRRAEEIKAKIAFTGELARVEAAEIQGRTVHRVLLGPYPNAQSLEAAKHKLDAAGIQSVAVRAR